MWCSRPLRLPFTVSVLFPCIILIIASRSTACKFVNMLQSKFSLNFCVRNFIVRHVLSSNKNPGHPLQYNFPSAFCWKALLTTCPTSGLNGRISPYRHVYIKIEAKWKHKVSDHNHRSNGMYCSKFSVQKTDDHPCRTLKFQLGYLSGDSVFMQMFLSYCGHQCNLNTAKLFS